MEAETEVKINKICIECSNEFDFAVNNQDYLDYRSGKKAIQDAFPYLAADLREMFITGLCGECFDEIARYWDE